MITRRYISTSPYYQTKSYGNFLDVLNFRSIPTNSFDVLYTIDQMYNLRPDLLSYDLYDTPSLWWVFTARNPDSLKDPVFDFRQGLKIYIPTKETLKTVLGI
jgi:hypothetical protein